MKAKEACIKHNRILSQLFKKKKPSWLNKFFCQVYLNVYVCVGQRVPSESHVDHKAAEGD